MAENSVIRPSYPSALQEIVRRGFDKNTPPIFLKLKVVSIGLCEPVIGSQFDIKPIVEIQVALKLSIQVVQSKSATM